MGNTRSEHFEPVAVDVWWNSGRSVAEHNSDKEIARFRERRLRVMGEKKKEMDALREENRRLRCESALRQDVSVQTETFEVPGELDELRSKNVYLEKDVAQLQEDLQRANLEISSFSNERKEYSSHVLALKDIIAVSKQLLLMRESQIKELGQKVEEIEASLAETKVQAAPSDDLRNEYERQLRNMKQLRNLYEERQKADKTEKVKLKDQLEEATTSLKSVQDKNSELQERVDDLEKENWKKYDSVINLESQLGLSKAECGELKAELSVINQLFSKILLSFTNGQEVDLDKLIKTLEENHDLLTNIMINEDSIELSSALPKTLLDLVDQVNKSNESDPTLYTIAEESESQTSTPQNSLNSPSEIVQNLPKVWKVLVELLSHQSIPTSVLQDNDQDPCYKSVQTPTGPTLVLSVSKTYIRLKNLILEKRCLERETTRLKQLNTHLETQLQDQEKRLETVSNELSSTWHMVGKMQKQHQQLHTQEKILRYELAQKRKLLNELKEELEYCREKWMQAREKNSTTEEQWRRLRDEFASRKVANSNEATNSAESGYSDEKESSSDEEDQPGAKKQTILGVIKKEIVNIESRTDDGGVVHSDATSKTDYVESNVEAVRDTSTNKQKDIDDIYKRLEEDILQTIKKTKDGEIYPGVSGEYDNRAEEHVEVECKGNEVPSTTRSLTTDEILARREERLKKMEEQAQQLVDSAINNSLRGLKFSNALTKLHDRYGERANTSEDSENDCGENVAEET